MSVVTVTGTKYLTAVAAIYLYGQVMPDCQLPLMFAYSLLMYTSQDSVPNAPKISHLGQMHSHQLGQSAAAIFSIKLYCDVAKVTPKTKEAFLRSEFCSKGFAVDLPLSSHKM